MADDPRVALIVRVLRAAAHELPDASEYDLLLAAGGAFIAAGVAKREMHQNYPPETFVKYLNPPTRSRAEVLDPPPNVIPFRRRGAE